MANSHLFVETTPGEAKLSAFRYYRFRRRLGILLQSEKWMEAIPILMYPCGRVISLP